MESIKIISKVDNNAIVGIIWHYYENVKKQFWSVLLISKMHLNCCKRILNEITNLQLFGGSSVWIIDKILTGWQSPDIMIWLFGLAVVPTTALLIRRDPLHLGTLQLFWINRGSVNRLQSRCRFCGSWVESCISQNLE